MKRQVWFSRELTYVNAFFEDAIGREYMQIVAPEGA